MIVLNCMLQECTRKESEYASNAALFKEKYQSVCKQMSIKVRVLIYQYICTANIQEPMGNSFVNYSHCFESGILMVISGNQICNYFHLICKRVIYKNISKNSFQFVYIKEIEGFSMFLSSCRNTSGSLGEQENYVIRT